MTSPANRLLPGLLVLLVLNAVVFWPVLSFDFVRWDDDINITNNSLFTDPWSGSLIARFFAADDALRFKPLHWLLGRGIHAAAGLNPAAWHAFNLVLHLAAAALFYVVLRQVLILLGGCESAAAIRVEMAALFGAAIWSVHPLRAEAVAWATASTYPLSAVCVLAAFACYLRAHTLGAPRGWLVSAWMLSVMAYASYPVTVTFALWLVAVDKWLLPHASGNTAATASRAPINWLKHACFLAPAVLAVAITLWSRFATPGIFLAAPTVESVGGGTRATMAFASLSYLAGRIVWPVNLTPNVPPLTGSAFTPTMMALAGLACAVLLLCWQARPNRPLLALTVFGFAVISLPCLGLTERPTWPVDRYSYIAHLPLIGAAAVGLAMSLVTGRLRLVPARMIHGAGTPSPRYTTETGRGHPISIVHSGGRSHRHWELYGLAVAAIVVTVGSAVAARSQTMIWRDTGTLFTHMSRHPDFDSNPRQQGHIYVLWANHEAANGRPESAAQLLEGAQRVYVAAMQGAVAAGDYAEALALLSHVERHIGLTPTLRREKGAWLLRENRITEAKQELQVAAGLLSDDERVRALLAEAEALTAKSRSPHSRP